MELQCNCCGGTLLRGIRPHETQFCIHFHPPLSALKQFFPPPPPPEMKKKYHRPNYQNVSSYESDSNRPYVLLSSHKTVNPCKRTLPYWLLSYHQVLTNIGQRNKSLPSYISGELSASILEEDSVPCHYGETINKYHN
jgi:hypothetical protein